MTETKIIIAPKSAITVSEQAVHMTIAAISGILELLNEVEFMGLFLSAGMEKEKAKKRCEKIENAKERCVVALSALADDTQDALFYIAN